MCFAMSFVLCHASLLGCLLSVFSKQLKFTSLGPSVGNKFWVYYIPGAGLRGKCPQCFQGKSWSNKVFELSSTKERTDLKEKKKKSEWGLGLLSNPSDPWGPDPQLVLVVKKMATFGHLHEPKHLTGKYNQRQKWLLFNSPKGHTPQTLNPYEMLSRHSSLLMSFFFRWETPQI